MKVILLFALFAVATEAQTTDGTDCPVNPNADEPNCLIEALTELGYLLPAIGKFLCEYNRFQADQNVDNYNAGVKTFIDILKCTNCQVENYLGAGRSLEDFLVKAGETGADALYVTKILQILGIDETATKLACTVKNSPDALTDLTKLYCKLKKSYATDAEADAAAADAASGVVKFTKSLQCTVSKELGITDEKLEKSLGGLGHNLLEKILHNLFLSGKVDVINKAVCAVFDPHLPV